MCGLNGKMFSAKRLSKKSKGDMIMSNYIVSCCSIADITKEHFEKRNISYICFHFLMDGKEYTDDLGQSIPFEEFYAKMAAGADTSTSQVNVNEYVDYFTEIVKQGKDILHISFSSGLSGSFNSAENAAKIVMDKYPGRKIYVVDSLAASSGCGLLIDKVADLRDEGMDLEELRDWVEANKLKLHHWFFSTDLTFYIKGGRVSKTSGTIGTILGICPLLNVDTKGRLIPRAKIRSKKKVIQEIVKRMEEHAQDGLDYSGKCYISQSACMDDAKAVAELVEARFKKLNGRVEINYIGTTIGSHTGPGTVALFFWGDERV
jgi:DegV family protein with EDD domain